MPHRLPPRLPRHLSRALFPALVPACAALTLAACVDLGPEMGAEVDSQPTGLANPASEYCVSIGGKVVMRDTPDGQAGDCHLADGRVVDEWTLFREAKG